MDSLSRNSGRVLPYTYEEVRAELSRQEDKKTSWVKNALILLVTLVVFFQAGLIKNNPTSILILIGILFIHEGGHWMGMRLFGYQNIQMFFIPLFGAAVSGQSKNVSAFKKAIVCLLGPLPGIGLGILFLILYMVSGHPIYFQLMLMSLLVNAFNLLPFFPLDGGRFLQEVLFCRNHYVELCFKIAAALCIIGVAWLMKAWILLVFGVLGLLTVHIPFKLASIAHEIKRKLFTSRLAEQHNEAPVHDEEPVYKDIIAHVHGRFSARPPLKHFAGHVKMVYDQVYMFPPKLGATLLLLGIYTSSVLFAGGALVVSAVISAAKMQQREIIEYTKTDGTAGYKERRSLPGFLTLETEIDPERWVYHGQSRRYSQERIMEEGNWHDGRRHGEWKEYDFEGSVKAVTIFNKGTFVSRKERIPTGWKEKKWEELSLVQQNTYRKATETIEGPNFVVDVNDFGWEDPNQLNLEL